MDSSQRRRVAVVAVVIAIAATAAGTAYVGFDRQSPGERTLTQAWEAVLSDSRSAAAWAALGDAHAAMDHPEAALQAYRTAINVGTFQPDVAARLGFHLYSQGDDDGALKWLSKAQADGADVPMLEWTLSRLQKEAAAAKAEMKRKTIEPEPATRAPPMGPSESNAAAARASQPASPAQAQDSIPTPKPNEAPLVCDAPLSRPHAVAPFHLSARIGGTETVLILDTGASITALSDELVEELGLPVDEERIMHAITATGPATFPTVVVPQVQVASRMVVERRVAVCQGCGGKHADGLLGLDLQAALGMRLDLQRSRVRFMDCEP